MKLLLLRGRTVHEPDAYNSIVEGLLEVLLCGLGAAAALMMVYSTLPKAGWAFGDAAADASRAPTRAEPRESQPQTRSSANNLLTFIHVEAPPHAGLAPEEVEVRGFPTAVCWTEGNEKMGWHRYFLTRHPLPTSPITLVCVAGAPSHLPPLTRLTIGLNLDGLTSAVAAEYMAPAVVSGAAATAGAFRLTALPGSPRIPGQPLSRTASTPAGAELTILTINPADHGAPVSGITH